MEPPKSLEEWTIMLRERFSRRNRSLGLPEATLAEVFRVTGWGALPSLSQIETDFPGIIPGEERRTALQARLKSWGAYS